MNNSKKIFNGEIFYLCDYEPIDLSEYIDKICNNLSFKKPKRFYYFFAKIFAYIGDVLGFLSLRVPYNSFRLRNIMTCYLYDTARLRDLCGELLIFR